MPGIFSAFSFSTVASVTFFARYAKSELGSFSTAAVRSVTDPPVTFAICARLVARGTRVLVSPGTL